MGDSSLDVNFTALPPDLQMKLWVLALDASTGRVAIAYKPGTFVTSLTYNYGGNLQASLKVRSDLSLTAGVNPSNGQVDVGGVFRGFNFGTYANFTQKSAGLSLSYGAKLLPFPSELSSTFDAAAGGLRSMAGDISAAPNNPLAWYKLHSNDATALSKAASALQDIAKSGSSSDRFGAGLRLNYNQQSGFLIYGAAEYRF
ncbi:MAG TPA: hypothetical protein VMU05_05525 [Dongiaceae bacterium]|nr:hypothetical protein [Dongiaceae bacterium]